MNSWRLTISRPFESGYLSDAIVKVGEEELRVHKAVLCEKSSWFQREFGKTEKVMKTCVHSWLMLIALFSFAVNLSSPWTSSTRTTRKL
jgi:hypothetical protein